MKNVLFTLIISIFLFYTNHASANLTDTVAFQNTQAKSESPICNLITQDDKRSFHKALKLKNIKIREIFYGTECNGQNILMFSLQNQADSVSKYIINRLPKHTLSKVIYLLKDQDELASIADRKLSNWNTNQI